jgi:hypothetical protein
VLHISGEGRWRIVGLLGGPLLLLLSMVLSARAECPAEPRRQALDATAGLEAAFTAVDDAAFAEAKARLEEAVPCVREPLTPADAAQIHLGKALVAFFGGDNAGTARAFTAVRVLQPEWIPPSAYMAPGNPLREIWNLTAADDTAVAAPAAPPGGWRIDGVPRSDVPAARAFVAQAVADSGEILATTWSLRASELQPWEVDKAPARRSGNGVRLGGTGVSLLLVGAGAGALAVAAGTDVSEVPPEDVVSTGTRANRLAGVGVGCGVAGLAIGVAAWTVRF